MVANVSEDHRVHVDHSSIANSESTVIPNRKNGRHGCSTSGERPRQESEQVKPEALSSVKSVSVNDVVETGAHGC